MANQTASPAPQISDQALRAMAICLVVLIHFLSSQRQSPYVADSPFHFWAVVIDQLGRLSVPLFVALSGYGLSQKYLHARFSWAEFLRRRVWKLLPLYLGWSAVIFVTLQLVPRWQASAPTTPFWQQLILGEVDYHLYFVPMIFQLYLLFPFLFKAFRRQPIFVLASSLLIQLSLYLLFSSTSQPLRLGSFVFNDQHQYVLGANWLFYFVLGMALAAFHRRLQRYSLAIWIIFAATLAAASWNTIDASFQIQRGLDPIIALRFTRVSVLIYASLAIISLTFLVQRIRQLPAAVSWLGKHSYSIYLAHTLVLRALFT